MVTAAKKEGVVVVNTMLGVGWRRWLDSFEQAFPGITVEHANYTSGSILAPKVLKEREADVYSYDVTHGPPNTAVSTLLPANVWDPIREVIIQRPDVTDDKHWYGGFDWGFVHKDKKWTYVHNWRKRLTWYINTDQVREGEIRTVNDLLNPKWKGKMLLADVRIGSSFIPATAMRMKLGDDVLKKLFVDQSPAYSRDDRYIVEQMIRGNYAITNRIQGPLYAEYSEQGFLKNVKQIEIPETTDIAIDSLWLFNKAPHPNAARLYINWLLTKEGQNAWKVVDPTYNSRRRDVEPNDPAAAFKDGEEKGYLTLDTEVDAVAETQKLLDTLVLR